MKETTRLEDVYTKLRMPTGNVRTQGMIPSDSLERLCEVIHGWGQIPPVKPQSLTL